MISPDCVVERKIRVEDYKPSIPSPISFNVWFRSEKCSTSLGLTFKEAKELHKQLGTKIRRMMRNGNNKNK